MVPVDLLSEMATKSEIFLLIHANLRTGDGTGPLKNGNRKKEFNIYHILSKIINTSNFIR